jgi:acyl dehydratase
MPETPLISELEKRSILSRMTDPIRVSIEEGAIQRFAEAIGDPNPLWNDRVAARTSRFGGIIAPPTFLRSVRMGIGNVPELSKFEALDGGSEWFYKEPVRVGDEITAITRVVEINQRTLRIGPALIVVAETTYTNQFDQEVATQRATSIRY